LFHFKDAILSEVVETRYVGLDCKGSQGDIEGSGEAQEGRGIQRLEARSFEEFIGCDSFGS